MWQNILNGVLGLVVFLLAFIGLTGATLTWTLAVIGLVIAFVGFSGLGSGQQTAYGEHQHSTR